MNYGDKVLEFMQLRKPRAVDETKLTERIEQGRQAEELLRNEALQRAFRQLDESYQSFWRNTSADDTETRERAWLTLKVLDDVRNILISTVREGAVAQRELEKALRR